MDTGNLNVLGKLEADILDKHEQNTLLNAFRTAINGSRSIENMVDGITDEYEDETGIDTASSTNEVYDSVNDLYSPAGSTSDKLLLNLNGTDGATSTTDASPSAHSIVFNGTAQLDTAQKKFGTASLLLDGNSDFLTVADSSDWDIFSSTSGNKTIDFWFKLNTTVGDHYFIAQRHTVDELIQWRMSYSDTAPTTSSYLNVTIRNGGSQETVNYTWTTPDTNWHHLAMIKVGSDVGLYLDGTQLGYVSQTNTPAIASNLTIGYNPFDNDSYLNGWLDDIRINNTNIFSGSPNVGVTDTITIPTSEIAVTVDNMTLFSDPFTAQAQPDTARLVLFEEDVDSITLNTDLLAYVSRDGGTTYTQVTLADIGNYDADGQILAGEVDISAQPAGTSMKYKIVTANNKNLKLHGIGELWD